MSNITVSSGNVSSGLIIPASTFVSDEYGGYLVSALVQSGGSLQVFLAGSALATTVSSGGAEQVYFSGIVSNTIVQGGGTEQVSSGGITISTTLSSGAVQSVGFSGTTSNTQISSGAQEVVLSGGVAIGTVISSGGYVLVSSGGVLSGATVLSGGVLIEVPGAVVGNLSSAAGAQVFSSGAAIISNNSIATSASLLAGFTVGQDSALVVLQGGSASADLISGQAFVAGGGSGSGITIASGASMEVLSGGLVVGDVIQSGGIESVSSGGVDNNATVSSGGVLVISAGGSANNVTVAAGGLVVDLNGHLTLASNSGTVVSGGLAVISGLSLLSSVIGTTSYGFAVTANETAIALAGNVLSGGSVSGGGVDDVYAFASAVSVTISNGGVVNISSGGTALSDIVTSGGDQIISSVGTASGTLLKAGTEDVLAGGLASNTVVSIGGNQRVQTGGSASGTQVSSGGQFNVRGVGAVITGAVISNGGAGNALLGGMMSGGSVLSGAHETVWMSGTDRGVTVSSGGTEFVSSGGIASASVIFAAGSQVVRVSGLALGTVLSGGTLQVSSGGSANGTVINSGGFESIRGGGLVTNTVINAGGSMTVSSATAIAGYTSVNSGGIASAAFFGSMVSTIVSSGGVETVLWGGIASATTLLSGAVLSVYYNGIASGTRLSSGGFEYLYSGGVESGGVVSSGAQIVVGSGGVTSNAVLSSGGYEVVSSGATAIGTVVSSGATLVVLPGGLASGTVGGVVTSNPLTLATGNVVSTGAVLATFENWTIANSGAAVAQVNSVYAAGTNTFSLTSGEYVYLLSGETGLNDVVNGANVSSSTLERVLGGTASGSLIVSGGFENVAYGGLSISATASAGGTISAGVSGTVSGAQISSGGELLLNSGAVASAPVIYAGGELILLAGATATGVINSGGQIISAGVVLMSGTTVVSSGAGVVANLSNSSGSILYALSGGTAVSAIVNGGEEIIASGGIASASQITSGGSAVISSGGSAVGDVLSGVDAAQYVLSGAVVISTILSSGGSQNVSSGGLAIGDIVLSGGNDRILAGGSGSAVVVSAGGQFQVRSSGSVMTSAVINSGGSGNAWFGGLAVATVVNGGNVSGTTYLYVFDGGSATSTSLISGGDQSVYSGGFASGTQISSGALEQVFSSGTAISSVIFAYGSQTATLGGSITGTQVQLHGNASVLSGGFATGTVLNAGGIAGSTFLFDFSGGTAVSTTAISGGAESVYSGGVSLNAQIGSGGLEYVFSAGTATSGVISQGGNQSVYSGGVVNATNVLSGGVQMIGNLGTATNTIVSSGGVEVISSGGVASNTQLALGAAIDFASIVSSAGITASLNSATDILTISSGGVTTSVQLSGSYAGDTLNLSLGSYGGTEVILAPPPPPQPVISGISAMLGIDAVAIQPFSQLTITDPGTGQIETVTVTPSTTLNGAFLTPIGVGSSGIDGSYTVSGTADYVTSVLDQLAFQPQVISAGHTDVTSFTISVTDTAGSSAINTAATLTISAPASIVVASGATSTSLNIGPGTTLTVSSGGTETYTVISSGGTALDYGRGLGTTVASSGTLIVTSTGAVASNTTILSGGTVSVSLGGGTLGDLIYGGGLELVQTSGVAIGASVQANGTLIASSTGAVASNTTVYSGGAASATFGGSLVNTMVNSFGLALVSSGGTAIQTQIGTAGALQVLLGGSATSSQISSGGQVDVYSSGSTTGDSIFSVGVEYVSKGGVSTSATVSGFNAFLDVISSGSAVHATVSSGGELYLYGPQAVSISATITGAGVLSGAGSLVRSGGLASATQLISGGDQIVSSGGSASFTFVSGTYSQEILQGGTATSTSLGNGGEQLVSSGGIASATSIGSGGEQVVSSSGHATGTLVTSGGIQVIEVGSIVSNTSVTASGSVEFVNLAFVSGATATINSSTDVLTVSAGTSSVSLQLVGDYTSMSANVTSGGDPTGGFGIGGVIYGTLVTIVPIGPMPVISTGTTSVSATDLLALLPFANDVISDHDATQTETVTVTPSSTANGTLVAHSGGSVNSAGVFTVTGTQAAVTSALDALTFAPQVISAGNTDVTIFTISAVDSAGFGVANSATSVTISAPATFTATSGFTYNNLNVGPGTRVTVSGTTVDMVISSGGSAYVPNGSAISTTVDAYGALQISTGATASNTTISSGGAFLLINSVNASGSVVSSGGFAVSLSDTANYNAAFAGITSNVGAIFVTSGIFARSYSGFETLGLSLSGQVVGTGGSVQNDEVLNSGSLTGTVIHAGGIVSIDYGGVVISSVISSGGEIAAYGGSVVSASTVSNGGFEVASLGTSISAVVLAGGLQIVGTTASATSAVLSSGGRQIVSSGGTAIGTVVSSGGVEALISGAIVSQTTALLGASINFENLVSSAGGSVVFNSTTDVLSVTEGSVTSTILLTAIDAGATFSLSSGTFGGTNVTVATISGPQPSISGTLANQIVADNATIRPFSAVTISDTLSGELETVTITPSTTSNGSFSNLTSSVVSGATVYVISGTAAAVTSALDAAIFVPTSSGVSAGSNVTEHFTLSVVDAGSGSATDTTTSVVITLPAVVTGQPVSSAAALQANTAVTGFSISDSAANVAAALSSLQADSKLSTITLTDSTTPTFTLTFAQFNADTAILGKITSPYKLVLTGVTIPYAYATNANSLVTSFTIADSGSNVASYFSTLPSLSKLTAISLTDNATTVSLPMTSDQYSIDQAVLALITSSFTLTVSGAPVGQAGTLQADSRVTGFTTYDTLANTVAAFSALSSDTKLTAIQFSDSGTPVMTLTASQYAADTALLAKITTPFTVNATNASVAQAASLQANAQVSAFSISDQAVNLTAQALTSLQTDGKLSSISILGTNTQITLTAAQYAADTAILAKIVTPYTVTISTLIQTDSGTSLTQVGSNYFIASSGGVSQELKVGGSPAVSGAFGTYNPIGAVAFGGGFEVAFSDTFTGQAFILATDASGNYTSIVASVASNTDYSIEQQETAFSQDLNGDGTVGPTSSLITSNAPLALLNLANVFEITSSGVLQGVLQVGGSAIVSGQFAGFNPVALLSNAGGYEVMFQSGTSFLGLEFSTNGGFISAATAILAGSGYLLESLEASFGVDLNGDGTTGVRTNSFASNGVLALVDAADEYEITSGGVLQGILQVAGSPISSGNFAGYAPVGVLSNAGGYEVMFQSGTGFLGLEFSIAGAFVSAATSVLAGSSYALESLETAFNVDLNGDHTTGVKTSSIETNGGFSLVNGADAFVISSGGVVQAVLQVGGSQIISGQFAGFSPVAVLSSGGGYEVMFQSGTSFLGLDFNASGNFTQAATSVLASGSYALESLETVFNFDLNHDGTTGPVTSSIATSGAVALLEAAGSFEITSGGVVQGVLQVAGVPIISGQFAGFTPVALLSSGGGYEVMFKSGTSFVGFDFDSGGNFTSAGTSLLAGSSYALESLETAFGVDLNGDGTTGTTTSTIETSGAFSLMKAADAFEITSGGTSAILQVAGSQIVSGNFAGYNPVAALSNAGGYEVMFQSGTGFLGLEFSAAGAYVSAATSVLASSSYALQSLETVFGFDINGDGTTGPKTSTIETHGGYSLVKAADAFEITSGGTSAFLAVAGSQIVSGQFAGFNPVAVLSNTGGYEVMFQSGSSFLGLEFSTAGAFISASTNVLAGSSYALESLETAFGFNLNGDGTTGPTTSTIETHGGYSLVNAADAFEITSGGTSAILQVAGSQIVSGQFAGFAPLAVLSNTGGYEVMFQSGTGFIGFDFDANGNFTSAATALLSASSPALWAQEVLFGDDLNTDGQIGTPVSTIQIDSGTTLALSGTAYTLTSTGGAAVSIEFGGAVFTSVSSVIPIGAIAVAGGYEVAWDVVGQNEYAVWKFDTTGNFASAVTTGSTVGLVTGQDFSLEQFDPAFGQDLGGSGHPTSVLSLGASTLTLTSSSPATLVQLANNTASAVLNASTISVTGSPGTLFLSSATAVIEYALQPSAGVEVISGFQYTVDELNIDLLGAASTTLAAASGIYNGSAAITLFSTSNPADGIILTGYGAGVTAANIISGHTSFIGGHALIS